MSAGTVLLLVGSPKASGSTSEALGSYLARALGRGGSTETVRLSALSAAEALGGLAEKVGRADVVVLSFPLYFDSIPAAALRALEAIAAAPATAPSRGGAALVAVVNSGFPEAAQSSVALAQCRLFAAEARLRWAGGLALGCGEAIGGRPLESLGGMTRKIRRALDLAAEAIDRGEAVPEAAEALLEKSLAPPWAYPAMGALLWRARAWRHGAAWKLGRKPYA